VELRVDRCGPEVAEIVHRLTQAAFAGQRGLDPPSGAGKETLESVRAELGERGGALARAADGSGEVVGCLRFHVRPGALYVYRVAVPPRLQGRGVGRALMGWAEGEAGRLGLGAVEVGVRIALPDNVAFYRALGYEVVAEHAHPGYDHPTSYEMRKPVGG
jgi:ribosomal protein S18 acetylase RimI-like enzyme